MWKENRKKQLESNLEYIKSLLNYETKDSIETPTAYIYSRIEDIKKELKTLE